LPAGPPEAASLHDKPKARRKTLPGAGWLLFLDIPVLTLGLGIALLVANRIAGGSAVVRTGVPGWTVAALLVPLSLTLAGVSGLYRPGILRLRRRQAAAGARTLIWSAAVSVVGVFLLAAEIPAALRGLILAYHGALGVWVLGARPLLAPLLRPRAVAGEGRVLILGADLAARDLAKGLTYHTRGATEVVSFADDRAPELRGLQPFRQVDLREVADTAEDLRADLVVVARKDLPREEIIRLSDELIQRGIRVKVLSNVLDRLFGSIPIETIQGLHLLQVGETPLHGMGLRIKRLVDIAGTILGGIVIVPLLAAIALAIKLSSPGPVLYQQVRIGRAGRPFTMYKFRSMVVQDTECPPAGEEDHLRYLRNYMKNGTPATVDVQGKKVYKRVDDPRITPVGHLLRRTSLDELPQLWNVLRGEMTLIGPRPCLPFEYDLYDDWQRRRLDVIPGMTGLWQVTGRSYVTFDDQVLLDLFYIGNWSLGLDIKILLRTIPVILFGKGGL
jgi:exopolysaccharide biosynthesis polyprenyl glycosylphosphotransferase